MSTAPERGWVRAAGAVLPLVAVAAAFLHALTVSWRKWGNLLVDCGRELELAHRVADGARLYSDARNLYGPLPTWVNAALLRAFGVRLDVLVAAGVLAAAVMTLAIYLLVRRFASRATSTAAAAVFVYVSAFGHLVPNPSFNWVIPYTPAATYGITLATLSLLFAVRFAQGDLDRDLHLSVGLAAAVALCKLEPLVAIGAAHAALLAGTAASGRLGRRRVAAYGAAGAAVLGVYGLLTLRVGLGLWRDNVLSAAGASVARYALQTMGLDDVGGSLAAAGGSALLLGAALGGGALVAWLGGRWPSIRVLPPVVAVVLAGALFAVAGDLPIDVPLRALPFVALGVLAALVTRFLAQPEARPGLLAHAVLWAFVAGALARLLLRTVPYHYGFYLVPVPLAATAIAAAGGLNEPLGRRAWPRLAALPAIGLVGGIAFGCFQISSAFYAFHEVPVETARGRLLLLPNDAAREGIELLSSLPKDARVVTVPFGTGIVFMSGRRWADASFTYFPTDLAGGHDDASLVRRWSAAPPDAFVYFPNDMREFGFQGFGVDYARQAAAWIDANYRRAGSPGPGPVLLVPRAASDPRPAPRRSSQAASQSATTSPASEAAHPQATSGGR